MEICPSEPLKPMPQQSIIEAKNKLRLGHDECCNCCCCCLPQSTCYKYVQPEIPKSFAPIHYYWKSNVPMDKDTMYRLSYWEGPSTTVEPIRPEDNLTCGDTPMSDETTHKMSYFGNWCVKTDPPITPCDRQWLGRGPMEDVTTHKRDYSWKSTTRPEVIKAENNLYPPCSALSDDTTYRLSYYNSSCLLPVQSFAPVRKYVKSDTPMEGCTTYKLSYWPNETPLKDESYRQKGEYHRPVTPMDGCTTYKLSYWPHCDEKPPEPFSRDENENLLNAGCCFDDNTTYRLSYFGCDGDKPPDPIRQPGNMIFSPCPLSHDTVNRLSFLGNWCFKPETSITPCDKQLLGRGPMQDETTQKHDYTWKRVMPPTEVRPENNLTFSSLPLESCTTHRLSYIPNDHECLLPIKSYAPICKYQPSDVAMESETTMRLSYQPVEPTNQIDKPWAAAPSYYSPVNPMEDNTTYNLSYIPPGVLVPLSSCSASYSSVNAYESWDEMGRAQLYVFAGQELNDPRWHLLLTFTHLLRAHRRFRSRETDKSTLKFSHYTHSHLPSSILAMILGLAVAQDQNYHGRNYQQNDEQHQADNRRPTSTTPIPILHWNKQQEHDGTYKIGYETGNNIIAEESGYIKTIGEGEDRAEAIVQQGTFSYTSPEGQLITIHYTADETGFHAQGDHIPTPPPVSEEIQKGLDLIYAGIRQQEEEDARAAAQKAQQPLSQQVDRRDEYNRKYQ
ncbi:PREDICTED: LOW QUALITY PROTEIN: stabilizer of axonemal microtubules 1-like [Cyphomyrmex costatus]|uniref:LOW QUALITY PROTEIN: stabilizer of axonemal microtubules 1-like n=1 Tax=Cyphomyrmex costatus TaxID=456900 RepID=UPI0008524360|nr:PREDICTED: LOW QUALITY PROTEIN: stabilizer of axonemal microtubules 1-like [Cyphomyrmex costatus]